MTWKKTFLTVDSFSNRTSFIYTEEEHPLSEFPNAVLAFAEAIKSWLNQRHHADGQPCNGECGEMYRTHYTPIHD